MSFSDKLKELSKLEDSIKEESNPIISDDDVIEDIIVSAVCSNFWCKCRYDKPNSDKRTVCYKCDSFDSELSGGVVNNGLTKLPKSYQRYQPPVQTGSGFNIKNLEHLFKR